MLLMQFHVCHWLSNLKFLDVIAIFYKENIILIFHPIVGHIIIECCLQAKNRILIDKKNWKCCRLFVKTDWNNDKRTRSKGGYMRYENSGHSFLNSFFQKAAKYNILSNGLKNDYPDYNCLNFRITIVVQNSKIKTKRFSKY